MKKTVLCVAFCSLAIFTSLNAQIVYKDIADGIPTGIDFNSDGTNEFVISGGNANGDHIDYSSGGASNNIHAIGTINTTNWDVPSCVSAGYSIGVSGNWEGQGDCAVNGWGTPNPTITVGQDTYLAMRFNLSGSAIYYGWVRISVDNQGNVTYKDYAYESTPNKSIKAGEKTTSTAGINSINNDSFTIFPNPAKNVISITNNDNILQVNIINTLGETVYSSAKINSSIDISNYTSGVYIVEVKGKTTSQTIKLIVQ